MLAFPAAVALMALSTPASLPAAPPTAPPAQQIGFQNDPVLRLTIPIRMGGQTRHFLIDTGAERSGISIELAHSLGLPTGDPLEVTGFAGTSLVATVPIPVPEIIRGKNRNLTALALSRDAIGADGFFGLDTLRGKVVVFDFGRHEMLIKRTIYKPGGYVSGPDIVADVSVRGSRLVFSRAKTNGVNVQAVLDTGSSLSVGNDALRQVLKSKNRYGTPVPILMLAVTGERIPAELVLIRDLWISDIHIQNMPIAFAGREPFDALGLADRPALLLGMDVLREFDRVEIDFANNQVWFTTKPNTGYILQY